jgi:hypothetical protein
MDLHIYFECKLYRLSNPHLKHILDDILHMDFQNNFLSNGMILHHSSEYIPHLNHMVMAHMDFVFEHLFPLEYIAQMGFL